MVASSFAAVSSVYADHEEEASPVTRQVMSFADLNGWQSDDLGAALSVFSNTCIDMKAADWAAVCALARSGQVGEPKAFFELFFRPVLVSNDVEPLFTGYYEPELPGSRYPTPRFKYPVYRKPPEVTSGTLWFDRRQIMTTDVAKNRGLEIAWVEDPVDLHFLQIQGSGRLRLQNGQTVRLGYGGSNGRPYRSLGNELVRRGIYDPSQVSAPVIRNWVRRNPIPGMDLLYHNTNYVFFRELPKLDNNSGPLGAMNRSITPMRSVAIDPDYVPLGAPVWLEKDGPGVLQRLMIAQDTGSAVNGPQRADIFFGTGDAAGRAAGRLRDTGRMVVLMPIQRAYAIATEGQS